MVFKGEKCPCRLKRFVHQMHILAKYVFLRAVGSLVIMASVFRPEDLGSIPDAAKDTHRVHVVYVLIKSIVL